MQQMRVLVTGGAGYVGSAVAHALADGGHQPIVLDDLSAGRAEFVREMAFYRGDIADADLLGRIHADHGPLDAVIHCAASIVVPESVARPDLYYDNNVGRTVTMLRNLGDLQPCPAVLFSSSASIYAAPADGEYAVTEDSPVATTSPYGTTKAFTERILEDLARAGLVRAVSLRYFNPIGADPQLRVGLQNLHPSHILGKLVEAYETGGTLQVTGTDWPTSDGTGVRDYIHVWDLALAHVAAVESFGTLMEHADDGYLTLNVGTGTGTTVRGLVRAFEEVVGQEVPTVDAPARPGDAVGAYARTDLISSLLDWRPTRSIAEGIRDSLAWRKAWLAQVEPTA